MYAFAEATTSVEIEPGLSCIINPATGIVSRVIEWRADGTSNGLPICAAALVRGCEPPACGYGKGLSQHEAMLGAVGEALEIHASSSYEMRSLRRARFDELDGEVLDPQALCLYASPYYDLPAFPYARFERTRTIDWTPGYCLNTGRRIWVPALPVFRKLVVAADERFCQVTSNGLATGSGISDAVFRATLELIERDAFMLSWFCRLPGRELDIEGSIEPGTAALLQDIRRRGAQIKFYVLNAGIDVPTVVCIARGDGRNWPGAMLGLGCHLNLRVALRKAILELGQTGLQFCHAMRTGEESAPGAQREVQTFRQHALFYLPAERNGVFDFLGNDGRKAIRVFDVPEPENPSLERLTGILRQAGIRVAIVDLTTPQLRNSGFCVVRALGENMQQIHCGYGRERLDNPRLRNLLRGPINLAIPPLC
jgi:ribosomal protein S12 methylthiotransferase accessory factor